MFSPIAFAAACASVVVATLAGAQRPNLSGTWAAFPADTPATVAKAPSAVMGALFGLRLDDGTALLTRPVRELGMVATFPLNGARTTSRIPGRMCEGEAQFHETVTWAATHWSSPLLARPRQVAALQQKAAQGASFASSAPIGLVVVGTMSQGGQSRQA